MHARQLQTSACMHVHALTVTVAKILVLFCLGEMHPAYQQILKVQQVISAVDSSTTPADLSDAHAIDAQFHAAWHLPQHMHALHLHNVGSAIPWGHLMLRACCRCHACCGFQDPWLVCDGCLAIQRRSTHDNIPGLCSTMNRPCKIFFFFCMAPGMYWLTAPLPTADDTVGTLHGHVAGC